MLGGNTIRPVEPTTRSTLKDKAPRIEDSIEWHYYQTSRAETTRRSGLVAILVERALEGIHWLESLGIEFRPNVFTVVGSSGPGPTS